LKRWIALVLGIIALSAAFVQLRRMAAREMPLTESISAQSRAQLDDVVRKSTKP
jgi:hypothetical protein